jgi:hypothetical protein
MAVGACRVPPSLSLSADCEDVTSNPPPALDDAGVFALACGPLAVHDRDHG